MSSGGDHVRWDGQRRLWAAPVYRYVYPCGQAVETGLLFEDPRLPWTQLPLRFDLPAPEAA